MKRILLGLLGLLLLSNTVQASHLYGGEITWECLANGKFVFKLDIYRECSGVQFGYSQTMTQQLSIVGSPGPRNQNNQIINSITVKADWNRFVNGNNGDITPQCPDPNGISLQCSNDDRGAIQRLPFISDPITLTGVPPAGGWTFTWSGFARPRTENIPQVALGLRATMYRIPNPNGSTPPFLNVSTCADASPRFAELPAIQICRGYEFTYNHNAVDANLDSLVYSWDHPVDGNLNNINQTGGYTFNNPLPDQRFNTANIPATLNPLTGEMKQAIYSGSGTKAYGTVVRVDAWRCGQVIASIWRDIPFLVFDCALLPQSGKVNNPPLIEFDGSRNGDTLIEVFAGELVEVGFRSIDNDLNFNNTPPFQKNTLEPSGFLFSKNFSNPAFCETSTIQPCATLSPPPTQAPGEPYKLTALSGINTQFRWQTDCNHISVTTGGACGSGTGQVGVTDGLFNFVMKTYDDHCPIRAINYPVITVKVKAPITLREPLVKGASVQFDGKINLQWVPPIDSATTFDHYEIEAANPNNGTNPTAFLIVQNNVTNYKQDKLFPYLNFAPNIFSTIPAGKDYYMRMKTFSGCSGDVPSPYSQAVQVIEVDAAGANPVPNTTPTEYRQANLTWNRAKPANANSPDYFVYESPTWFYIYENVEAATSPTDPSKWIEIGRTKNTSFNRTSIVCSDLVGYRIEARDTVITYDQGTRIPQKKYDTLTFSTFSTADALMMGTPGNVLAPELDTVQVLPNGDVYLTVNRSTAGPVGSFEFYEIVGGNPTLLGTATPPTYSFTHVGANATLGTTKEYEVVSIDKCQPTLSATSNVYNTMTPSGQIVGDPCLGNFQLNWAVPQSMTASNIRYRVYEKVGTGPFVLVASNLSSPTVTLPGKIGDTDYYYYVEAVNAVDEYHVSEVFFINHGPARSNEVVPAPNLRCIEVMANGNIKVTWEQPVDTTDNFESYRFQIAPTGTNPNSNAWVNFSGNNLLVYEDSVLTFTGLTPSAQNQAYTVRAASISGCQGNTLSPYAYIDAINLSVTANLDKTGDLAWNGVGVINLNQDTVIKDVISNNLTNRQIVGLVDAADKSYTDGTNGAACDIPIYYQVKNFDNIGQCVNVSNVASDVFIDQRPQVLQIDYVSVLADNRVQVQWSVPQDIDLVKLFAVVDAGGPSLSQVDSIEVASFPSRQYTFDLSVFNANDTTHEFALQPKDACGNFPNATKEEYNYHRTIDIDVEWNNCDSVMITSWNPYESFNVGEGVEYQVFWDTSGAGNFMPAGDPTTDTVFRYKVSKDFKVDTANGLLFTFYVEASPTGSGVPSFVSRSNRASETASYLSTPRYDYLHYANVLDDNQVELQVYPDKKPSIFTNIGQYVIYRGIDKSAMDVIGVVDKSDVVDSTFRYYDYNAQTNDYSYFYKVIVENTCDGPVDTTNFARTIHLRVNADNEALTNSLVWNEYEEWDSTVAFYNVYRSFNGGGYEQYDVVAPKTAGDYNRFIDDVYDELFAVGNFCYFVEAVQGPVTTEFGIDQDLDPAISRSNVVCVIQKPLFYIPNAFAPDGINKVFGPQGQFVDWSYYEMIIYNRWGEQVYITNDITKGWDGKVNGQDAQLGSYVYTIRFKDAEGQEHRRKGTVTVIK